MSFGGRASLGGSAASGASSTTGVITKLLANIDHYDKDERYMCLSDITKELNALAPETRLDPGLEPRLVAAVLGRLEHDSSNDVQAIAVKCLSVLVTRVGENSVKDMCEKLVGHMLTGSSELRDVYAIGLKTVIAEAPNKPAYSNTIVNSIAPKLLQRLAAGGGAGGASAGAASKPAASASGGAGLASADVRTECLDIILELIRRYGYIMEPQHGALLTALGGCLLEPAPQLRKRSMAALAALAPSLSDALLERLVASLLTNIEKGAARGGGDTRSMIQTVGSVSRAVGRRCGRYLHRIVPLFLSCLGDPATAAEDDSGNTEAANELRENILSAFESFFGVTASGSAGGSSAASGGGAGAGAGAAEGGALGAEVASALHEYRKSVVDAAMQWMSFDPNFTYGDEDEDAAMDGGAGEDEEDWGDDGGDYGDADDDSSWKSRRAALRVLNAVAASVTQLVGSDAAAAAGLLHSLTADVAPGLLRRFKEREDTVRVEVVAVVDQLVASTWAVAQAAGNKGSHSEGSSNTALDLEALASGYGKAAVPVPQATGGAAAASFGGAAARGPAATAVADLQALAPQILSASIRVLRDKDAKFARTRSSVLGLLRVLGLVLDAAAPPGTAPAVLKGHLDAYIPALQAAIKDKGPQHAAALRLEAALAVHALLLVMATSPRDIAPHLPAAAAMLSDGSKDDYYKIVAASMRGFAALAPLLRPADPAAPATALLASPVSAGDLSKVLPAAFDSVIARLRAHDIDQEIKEGAIMAAGALVAHAGDTTQGRAAEATIVSLLGERLKGESTRVPALRALAYASSSPLKLDLSAPLAALLPELAGFLRQNTRALRAQTLATLSAIVASNGPKLGAAPLSAAVAEACSPSLLSDADLHLCHLAAAFLTTIADTLPADMAVGLLADAAAKRTLELSVSPVLQGSALSSLVAFFRTCVSRRLGGPFAPEGFIPALIAGATARAVSRQALSTAAKCISAVQLAAPAPVGPTAVLDSLKAATQEGLPAAQSYLARLVVAEAARQTDILALQPSAAVAFIDILKASAASAGSGAVATGGAGGAGGAGGGADAVISAVSADDLRVAAALAEAGVVIGSIRVALPQLLSAVSAAAGATAPETYSLLQALREVIARHAPSTAGGPSLAAVGEPILSLLCTPSLVAAGEEGVRGIVAECLGRLAGVQPEPVVAALVAQARSSNAAARGTAVTAFRHAVALIHSAPALSAALKPAVPVLLSTLVDPDLSTRHAAVTAVTVTINTEMSLLQEALLKVPAGRFVPSTPGTPSPSAADLGREGVLAAVYYECLPRAELVKEVDLGPFKHKIDEGLPVRRAAFTALDSVLTHAPELLGEELLPLLCSGMRDAEDVRLLAHALLARAAGNGWLRGIAPAPTAVEALADALDVSVKVPTGDASASAPSSAVDVTRSAMRAVEALQRGLPAAATVKRFADVLDKIEGSVLSAAFAAIKSEASSASATRT